MEQGAAAPGRPLRVWVSRAQPGADETAQRLSRLGCDPLVAPVLRVQVLDAAALDLDGVGALAFTSANGVRALATRLGADVLTRVRALPVFAVGDATAEAARVCGFVAVESANADVAGLAALIATRRAGLQDRVLHACATEPAGDLAAALASRGVPARAVALYATLEADRLPPAVAEALEGAALDALLVHSPKAARLIARLVAHSPEHLRRAVAPIRALCLSQSCAAPLLSCGFGDIEVADAPSEEALLARLERP